MTLAGLDLALLGTVTVASLLGSLHCAVMCGPLISACQGAGGQRAKVDAAYHLARGSSYVVLGGAAGFVGAAVDWAGRAAGLVRAGAVVSGLLVVLVGVFWMVPGLSDRVLRFTRPLWRSSRVEGWLARRALAHGLVQLKRQRTTVRAGLLGLLTPALPCGYLYAFVLSAAGTGSALGGVLLMFAFWLGTLPALVLLGEAVSRLSRSLWRRLPIVTGLLFVTIGVLGVLGHALARAEDREVTPAAALEAVSRGHAHEHTACH